MDATFQFLKTLHRLGKTEPQIARQLCNIVSSGMYSGVFEIVVHDMTKENAKNYISALRWFYQAGWAELMQIKI